MSRDYFVKNLSFEGMERKQSVVRRWHWVLGSILCVRVLKMLIDGGEMLIAGLGTLLLKRRLKSERLSEGQKGVDSEAHSWRH